MERELCFYECEHEGDLRIYADDVIKSGGVIVHTHINYDAEIGTLIVNVDANFMTRFSETESYHYLT